MQKKIIYEQPLNEKIRFFLRLEHLFYRVDYRIEGRTKWDSRDALIALLEIVDLLARTDIKLELSKELGRHVNTLQALQECQNVNHGKRESLLKQLNVLLNTLRDRDYQVGQSLHDHALVQSVKKRINVPGGTCHFDLPGFYFWIEQAAEERYTDLRQWYAGFDVIRDAIRLCLLMLRNSHHPSLERATAGFYQRQLDAELICQMVCVGMDETIRCYPEISGGRHQFSIRFMEQSDSRNQPIQSEADIDFELCCCTA